MAPFYPRCTQLFKLTFILILTSNSSIAQVGLSNGTPANTQNFDGMGTTLLLPANWKMGISATPDYSASSTSVTQEASSGNPATGGTYNWGTSATERAVGAMTSGGFTNPNSLLVQYNNNGISNITGLTLSYDAERYRIHTAAASVQFFYSTNGSTWTAVTAGDIPASSFPTGTNSYSFSSPLIIPVTGISITGLNIAPTQSIYLRWNLNTSGSNSQGIGIDNVTTTASFATPCTPPAPSFTAVPASPQCTNQTVVYGTQTGNVNYVWLFSGVANVDYTLVSGGNATSATASIIWLTGGSKTVTVGYTTAGCASTTPASNTITVNSTATSISPSSNQNIVSGVNGTTLTVAEGTAPLISREWRFGSLTGSYPTATGITATT